MPLKSGALSNLGQRFGAGTKASTHKLANVTKHLGKTAARFVFELDVHAVRGVKPNATYFIKWTRGVKVARTQKFAAKGKEHAVAEKMSLMVSLFYDDSKQFDEKDAKISLVRLFPAAGTPEEKTVAKLHLDLAQYAGIPSASTKTTLNLSETVEVSLTLSCKYMKSESAAKNVDDGDDVLSMGGMSSYAESSVVDTESVAQMADLAELDDLGEFDDLVGDDDDAGKAEENSAKASRTGAKVTFAGLGLSRKQSFGQKINSPGQQARETSTLPNSSGSGGSQAQRGFRTQNDSPPARTTSASSADFPSARALSKPSPLASSAGVVGADAAALREENSRLKERLAETRRRADQAEREKFALEASLDQAKDELNALRGRAGGFANSSRDAASDGESSLVQMKRHASKLESENKSLSQNLKRVETERNLLRESDENGKIAGLQRAQDELMRESARLREENEKLIAEVEDLEEKLEHLSYSSQNGAAAGVSATLGARENSVQALATIQRKDDEIANLTSRIRVLERDLDSARKELRTARTGGLAGAGGAINGTDLSRVKTLEAENDALFSERAQLAARVDHLEQRSRERQAELDEVRGQHDALSAQCQRLKASNQQLSAELATAAQAHSSSASAGAAQADAGARKIAELRDEIEALKLEVLRTERASKKGAEEHAKLVEEHEAEVQNGRIVAKKLRLELDALRDENERLEREAERAKRSASTVSESVGDRSREHERELEDLRDEKDRVERRLERARVEAEAERDEISSAMRELRKQKNEMIAKLREELEDARTSPAQNRSTSSASAQQAESRAAKRLERLETQLETVQQEKKQLQKELDGSLEESVSLRRQLTEARLELGNARTELQSKANTAQADAAPESLGTFEDSVVQQLVEAKLRMADMEEENTRYKNIIQKMQRGNNHEAHRRIAEHASKLEVRLAEAHTKIDSLQLQIAKRSSVRSPR